MKPIKAAGQLNSLRALNPTIFIRAIIGAVHSINGAFSALCIAGYCKAYNSISHRLLWIAIIALTSAAVICIPATTKAYSKAQTKSFQRSIIDYRRMLNPKFKKTMRKITKYIIIHTSEANRKTTLKIVTQGKQRNGRWFTYGGHTHYVIARNGVTFRIMDKKFRADHAGLSMWNGETDISSISIGIELVGYHHQKITEQQYRSAGILIAILQKVYRLNDLAVLTHSQVAYANPNQWISRKHRGRKYCAMNFIRSNAGLGSTWSIDPDVKAGRILADSTLAAVYYNQQTVVAPSPVYKTITLNNTAWSIAGQDYNKKNTIYFLPSGRLKTGNQIIKWGSLPAETKMIVGYRGPYKVTGATPPIKIAGQNYNDTETIYYFPNKKLISGEKIQNFRRLPHNVLLFLPVKSRL